MRGPGLLLRGEGSGNGGRDAEKTDKTGTHRVVGRIPLVLKDLRGALGALIQENTVIPLEDICKFPDKPPVIRWSLSPLPLNIG